MGTTDSGQGGGAGNWMSCYLPEYTDTSSYQQVFWEAGGIKNSNAWAGGWGAAYKYGETSAVTSVSVKNAGAQVYQTGSALLVLNPPLYRWLRKSAGPCHQAARPTVLNT